MSENVPSHQPYPAAPQGNEPYQQPTLITSPPKKKWAAITALVLGIIGAVTGIILIGSFFGLVAIIFAIVALIMVKRGTGTGKKMAVVAIILAIVGFCLTGFAIYRVAQGAEEFKQSLYDGCNSGKGIITTDRDGQRVCEYGGYAVYDWESHKK